MSATATSLSSEPEPAPIVAPEIEAQPRTRAEINRANSQHSTGPRTAEGKARASMNALKHGLFAGEVVLPGEDREAFESLVHGYARDSQAETEEELSVAQDVMSSRWRARRLCARETALTALTTRQQRAAVEKLFEADFNVDADALTALAQAAGLQANARLFNQLWLAESRFCRRAELAESKLLALVRSRLARSIPESQSIENLFEDIDPLQPSAELSGREPNPSAAPKPASAPTSGFVPPPSSRPAFPANMPTFTGPLKKENRRQWLRKYGQNNLAKAA